MKCKPVTELDMMQTLVWVKKYTPYTVFIQVVLISINQYSWQNRKVVKVKMFRYCVCQATVLYACGMPDTCNLFLFVRRRSPHKDGYQDILIDILNNNTLCCSSDMA